MKMHSAWQLHITDFESGLTYYNRMLISEEFVGVFIKIAHSQTLLIITEHDLQIIFHIHII